jgi:hypothetical protein
MRASGNEDNSINCIIRDVVFFRTCLDSVRFPDGPKKACDVILQAFDNGIVLKSASPSGVIMTRCMIRRQFFNEEGDYKLDKNEGV